ncbi:sugar transferase [Bacillus sp. RIT 809]|uniref:sugar transferase n=1 Tax=Bacillus sp. RIT 809 TaxID=2803857 RepID=UPI00195140AD|nr:sugar transferase [Bacillus sp. RIT 809]
MTNLSQTNAVKEQDNFHTNLVEEYKLELVECSLPISKKYHLFKRILDIIFAIAGLVVFFPVIFIFGLLVKLETSGPIFYIQKRVGKNGIYFNIMKLRSMTDNAEKNGQQWAVINDPRVTKVGAFIRKTRIDELPQLINVLRGEMSLVGPRPERPYFTSIFTKDNPDFIRRVNVKPGITGYAQVNGGYDLKPADKLRLDLIYIEEESIYTDVKIIFQTIKIVFTGEGAR